MFREQYVE